MVALRPLLCTLLLGASQLTGCSATGVLTDSLFAAASGTATSLESSVVWPADAQYHVVTAADVPARAEVSAWLNAAIEEAPPRLRTWQAIDAWKSAMLWLLRDMEALAVIANRAAPWAQARAEQVTRVQTGRLWGLLGTRLNADEAHRFVLTLERQGRASGDYVLLGRPPLREPLHSARLDHHAELLAKTMASDEKAALQQAIVEYLLDAYKEESAAWRIVLLWGMNEAGQAEWERWWAPFPAGERFVTEWPAIIGDLQAVPVQTLLEQSVVRVPAEFLHEASLARARARLLGNYGEGAVDRETAEEVVDW